MNKTVPLLLLIFLFPVATRAQGTASSPTEETSEDFFEELTTEGTKPNPFHDPALKKLGINATIVASAGVLMFFFFNLRGGKKTTKEKGLTQRDHNENFYAARQEPQASKQQNKGKDPEISPLPSTNPPPPSQDSLSHTSPTDVGPHDDDKDNAGAGPQKTALPQVLSSIKAPIYYLAGAQEVHDCLASHRSLAPIEEDHEENDERPTSRRPPPSPFRPLDSIPEEEDLDVTNQDRISHHPEPNESTPAPPGLKCPAHLQLHTLPTSHCN